MHVPSRFHFRNHTRYIGGLPTADRTKLAVWRTPEAVAATGLTGSGGPGADNRVGLGSVQNFQESPNKLWVRATPGCSRLNQARSRRIPQPPGPGLFLFLGLAESIPLGLTLGLGGTLSRPTLVVPYRHICHQRRPGAALRADWAKSWCSWSICRSFAANCSVSIVMTSVSWLARLLWPFTCSALCSLCSGSWALVGKKMTHRPLTLLPLINPLLSRRRIVFADTESVSAAPVIVVSMLLRVGQELNHCWRPMDNLLTRPFQSWRQDPMMMMKRMGW